MTVWLREIEASEGHLAEPASACLKRLPGIDGAKKTVRWLLAHRVSFSGVGKDYASATKAALMQVSMARSALVRDRNRSHQDDSGSMNESESESDCGDAVGESVDAEEERVCVIVVSIADHFREWAADDSNAGIHFFSSLDATTSCNRNRARTQDVRTLRKLVERAREQATGAGATVRRHVEHSTVALILCSAHVCRVLRALAR
jgi:hypothetical protein